MSSDTKNVTITGITMPRGAAASWPGFAKFPYLLTISISVAV